MAGPSVAAIPNLFELPVGCKFKPTEQELVTNYLRPRALDRPLPLNIIGEAQVMRTNPWDIVPKGAAPHGGMYFFARKDHRYGGGIGGATGEGYWKIAGGEAPVRAKGSGSRDLLGMRRTLEFYLGNPLNGDRTEWVMREYRLAGISLNPITTNAFVAPCSCGTKAVAKMNARFPPITVNPDDSWVVCRIYKKKNKNSGSRINIPREGNGAPFIDFFGEAYRKQFSATTMNSLGEDEGTSGTKEDEGSTSGTKEASGGGDDN